MKSIVLVCLALASVAAGQQLVQQRRYPQILRLSNQVSPDGHFDYAYQTEDGISSEAHGALRGAAATRDADGSLSGPATAINGQYSYTGPDNQVYTVQYVADENGYRATGAHLPVAPAIPEAIQRSLELNARNPQQADEGSFQQRVTSFQQPTAFQSTGFQRAAFQQPQAFPSAFQQPQAFRRF